VTCQGKVDEAASILETNNVLRKNIRDNTVSFRNSNIRINITV